MKTSRLAATPMAAARRAALPQPATLTCHNCLLKIHHPPDVNFARGAVRETSISEHIIISRIRKWGVLFRSDPKD
ncbi:MAG: hypothetical protein LAO04_04165 [Acidobacteriia bacterium]|nr:hypothetical protein [Terriglobia bacterium]